MVFVYQFDGFGLNSIAKPKTILNTRSTQSTETHKSMCHLQGPAVLVTASIFAPLSIPDATDTNTLWMTDYPHFRSIDGDKYMRSCWLAASLQFVYYLCLDCKYPFSHTDRYGWLAQIRIAFNTQRFGSQDTSQLVEFLSSSKQGRSGND